MNKNYRNESGISVLQLKDIVQSWSEYNTDVDSVMYGDNCEVWIETESGKTSQLISITLLNKRSDREKHIFLARNLIDNVISYQELGIELGISHQRVSQIHDKSFEKIQQYVLTKLES